MTTFGFKCVQYSAPGSVTIALRVPGKRKNDDPGAGKATRGNSGHSPIDASLHKTAKLLSNDSGHERYFRTRGIYLTKVCLK